MWKMIGSICWRYRWFIFSIVAPFLLVNLFIYTDSRAVFSPGQISNIFSGRIEFSITGISIYVSIVTVLALLVALVQWKQNEDSMRKATINGLLEELRHNINMASYDFIRFDRSTFFRFIKERLRKLGPMSVYPNPTDDGEDTKDLFSQILLVEIDTNASVTKFLPLKSDFVATIANSMTFFKLKNKRLFLNLGHLEFSFRRYRTFLEDSRFNTIQNYKNIRNEYLYWVHYRMYFFLVDLVQSVDIVDVVDKKFCNEIRAL